MDRKKFYWISLVVIASIASSAAVAQQNGPKGTAMNYGGKWWLSRSSIEQLGYINGDSDCYTSQLRGNVRSLPSAEDVQKFVNKFYEDPTHWSEPIFRVTQMLYSERTLLHKSGSPQGEAWNEPHAYWDGLWWKGGTIASLSQLGYVEGYLACYKYEAHSPKETFSKSPAQYVSLISEWYQKTGQEDAKIADVLFKFRDQTEHSKPHDK